MAKSSSDRAPTEASTGEMVSEVKEIEGTRRSARLRGMNREGKKTISEAMFSSIDVEAKRHIPVKKSKAMQKKKRAKIEIPKKPPTAFFYFLEDFRKGYLNQNPHVKSMRHVGKACGEVWNTMSYEEKIKYYDIAMEKRAEFDKTMAEYTKRMESGEVYEDEEEEDWSS